MCWHAVRLDMVLLTFEQALMIVRLAYCELYVTIALLFHRFENLLSNKLTAADLEWDDYFASHHPIDAIKFHVSQGNDKS